MAEPHTPFCFRTDPVAKGRTSHICFIARNHKRKVLLSGGRARFDIETLLARHGAKNLGWKRTNFSNPILDFVLTFSGICKAMFALRKEDILVLQYPMHHHYDWVCRVARWKGAKIITSILDLGSFRRKRISKEQEAARLSRSSVLIVHCENMKRLLVGEYGCKVPMTTLEAWDFPTEGVATPAQRPPAHHPCDLLFVGDLSDRYNAFTRDLGKQLHEATLHLYGSGDTDSSPHLVYHGHTPADEIIRSGEGRYGLVWYGSSTTMPTGFNSDYIRYNITSKMSLYLRCGLPLIGWTEAGLADFIRRENCGLVVDTLDGIEARLLAVTPEEYEEMARNARRIAAKLAAGEYFPAALERALALL